MEVNGTMALSRDKTYSIVTIKKGSVYREIPGDAVGLFPVSRIGTAG